MKGPLTYVISYTENNTLDDAWAESISQAPPDLLHHGHDVPLNNLWGPTQGLSGWEPDHDGTPEDVRRKIDQIRRGTDRLHSLGVRAVIPYINPSIIGGTPAPPDGGAAMPDPDGTVKQSHFQTDGFFNFWQRREEFSELLYPGAIEQPSDASDPRYSTDPMDWMQRDRMSLAIYKPDCTFGRYEPCLRREPWLSYLESVVRLVAEAGYDGVFSDDNLVHCMCSVCQHDFRRFIESEYPDRINDITGGRPLSEVMLYSDDGRGTGPGMRRATSGKLGDGPDFDPSAWQTLLWQAGQAFWSETVTDMLQRIGDAGRSYNDNFFIVANWGMSIEARELGVRRRLGHDVRRWSRSAKWQMLEESGGRGCVVPGLVAEFWTSCRAVAAQGGEPVLLTYHGSDPRQVEVGYAEVASAGCGAYADGGASDLLKNYRSFFTERSELFENAVPYAPVGLYYSFDDIQRNNDDHLRLFYAAARALGRSHIPFDVVARESVGAATPCPHTVIINPGASDMPSGSGVPEIRVGLDGEAPTALLAKEEIDLDSLLAMTAAERTSALATWSKTDLRGPSALVRPLREALGCDMSMTVSPAAHAVRIRPFVIQSERMLVLHVVNYGWTVFPGSPVGQSMVESFPLIIPGACDGGSYRTRDIESVWTEGPNIPRETLHVREDSDTRLVDIPPTNVYRVVVVKFR
jgi:hypothetical protein